MGLTLNSTASCANSTALPAAKGAASSNKQATKEGDRPELRQLQLDSHRLPQRSSLGAAIIYKTAPPTHQPLLPISGHHDPHIQPCHTIIIG